MTYTRVILYAIFLVIISNLNEIQAFNGADTAGFSIKTEKENIAGQYEKVTQIRKTEDAENDFALMMTSYNSAVKFLLENQIKEGKDSLMISVARQTLRRHSEVEGILNTYIGKIRLAKNKTGKNSRADNNMEIIGSSVQKKLPDLMMEIIAKIRSLGMSGKQDYDFASLINYHCSGALNIIDDYLNKADDKVLEIVAQRLKDENLMSLQLIEKWKKSRSK